MAAREEDLRRLVKYLIEKYQGKNMSAIEQAGYVTVSDLLDRLEKIPIENDKNSGCC